jgi:hypothetical protein
MTLSACNHRRGPSIVTLRHRPHRVLFVPLDDRPCNARAPRLLAQLVDYELVSPPAEMLGRFREAGHADQICEWLRSHVDSSLDCIILSLDMVSYGGLWASRTSATRTQLAQERLNVLAAVRSACPNATIYAFGTVPRLGTVTSSDEAALYLSHLVRYSVLAGRVADEEHADERSRLSAIERHIPPAVLGEYLAVRGRNQEVNLRAIREVSEGNLDFLVLGQDTAAPEGLHRQEQAALREEAVKQGVSDRVMVLPGADELGVCLLARFVHEHMNKVPTVRVVSTADADDVQVAPGEDRPFTQSLAAHIRLVGAQIADSADKKPDMVLAVNSPAPYGPAQLRDPAVARLHRERARAFVSRAVEAAAGRGLAVCDAAFTNGADDLFVQELLSATSQVPQLLAYAGWNTASNSAGSALAQSSLRLIALQDKGAFDLARVVGDLSPLRYLSLLDALISCERAHIRLLITRFAEDWLYQARIRPRLTEHICSGLRDGVFDLAHSYHQAEEIMRDELTRAVSDLWIDQFLGRPCVSVGSDVADDVKSTVVLAELEETRLSLPWRRLFEIDVDLEFGVQLVAPGNA